MPSAPNSQLTLDFEPALPERFRTLRDFLAHRVQVQAKPAKTIAADMDMSPSTLSRKLTPGDGDTQRFNVDDLEHYIQVTGDTGAIEYLAAKYLCSDDSRKVRALARVESLSAELSGLVASLKAAA
jgi:hypothetical protein